MKPATVITMLLAGLAAGCQLWPARAEPKAVEPTPTAQADYLQKSALRYDSEPPTQSEGPVESALIWSERYNEALQRVVLLQNEKRALEERNRQLDGQLANLNAENVQYRKELEDANALLMEMRKELDNWKGNVLGFRDEMRSAQQAQLDALCKVIRLLGGEVVEAKAPTSDDKAVKSDESDQQTTSGT